MVPNKQKSIGVRTFESFSFDGITAVPFNPGGPGGQVCSQA